MSKKIVAVIIFLVLGLVVTYGVAFFGFATNIAAIYAGFPFKFTSFALILGESQTDNFMLALDVLFWSFILFGAWILIKKLFKK